MFAKALQHVLQWSSLQEKEGPDAFPTFNGQCMITTIYSASANKARVVFTLYSSGFYSEHAVKTNERNDF